MRIAIPTNTETELLQLSRRRCCLCFGLQNDFGQKKGQIAHLDHDATNNLLSNLAFLCLEHHDDYDSRTSQSKALTLKEVLAYKEALYKEVRLREAWESSNTGVVATHDEFPLRQLGNRLHEARERFLVWHTWSEYFNPFLAIPLQRFLEVNWRNLSSCKCRILLAHHSCPHARARAKRLKGQHLRTLVRQTVRDIEAIALSIDSLIDAVALNSLVQIRLYKMDPTAVPAYIVDDRAFVSWYPHGRWSHSSPCLEIDTNQIPLKDHFESAFVACWRQARWRWDFARARAIPIVLGPENDPDPGV